MKIVIRVIGGFICGVLFGQIIQILISLKLGQGTYFPVLAHFNNFFADELTAVIVQFILTGCTGIAFATTSLVFDIAKWGLFKQYAIHFCVTAIIWVPIVVLLWAPEASIGMWIVLINFLVTYPLIGWIQYTRSKSDIKQINQAIQSKLIDKEGED